MSLCGCILKVSNKCVLETHINHHYDKDQTRATTNTKVQILHTHNCKVQKSKFNPLIHLAA